MDAVDHHSSAMDADHHSSDGGGSSRTIVLNPSAAPASFVSRYMHAGRGKALRLTIWYTKWGLDALLVD